MNKELLNKLKGGAKLCISLIMCGLLLSLPVYAASTVVVATGPSTNSILTNGSRIQNVTIANVGNVAATVALFDAPSTNATYVLLAYTNSLSYATNILSTNTTFAGFLQTNTNSGIYTYFNTVTQSTNNYRNFSTVVVPANTTVTNAPIGGYISTWGLLSTNNSVTNIITITVNYGSDL